MAMQKNLSDNFIIKYFLFSVFKIVALKQHSKTESIFSEVEEIISK